MLSKQAIPHRVRLKAIVKVKLLGTIGAAALLIALFGLYFFDSDIDEPEFKRYFKSTVIEPPRLDAPEIGNSPGNRWMTYPYWFSARSGGKTYSVGSFKYLAIGTDICVGVLVKGERQEVLNYVNVEPDNCG